MARKVKCPSCGAKNAQGTHRCRVCTVVLDPAAPAREREAAVASAPQAPSEFDASAMERDLRPLSERVDRGGALGARLSGAPDGIGGDGDAISFDDVVSRNRDAPTVDEAEAEAFDPDALFRDRDD